MTIIKPNSTVLFQGDSITDWGRDRKDPDSLGNGYPLVIASMFPALFPELNVKFINRGIGGDRTEHLVARWQEDCIDLKPDFVSIMIGINDVWHAFNKRIETVSLEQFTLNYSTILQMIRENLDAQVLLMEPYVLHTSDDRPLWRADLDPKREAVKELAHKYDAIFVPIDAVMQEAARKQEPGFWCPDGVHPAPAGHGLIAKAWLEAVGAL
ncbi:MAG: SGNH/GDSL hydrolase family protein [Firmicutes bacterium]|jgi:lysophospholipase L1-like esterase|nr:SGNH/GDSL hydrolase family protein [Bacillota bacterium]HKM16599.1 SGNH/GDSL hydrolase family protein [Limnochordia bacterium]